MSDSFVDYLEVARDYQDTKMALNSIMRTLDHLSDVETILCRLENKPSAVAPSKAMQGLLGNVVYLDTSSKFKPGTEGFMESVKETLRKIWDLVYGWFEKAVKHAAKFLGISATKEEKRSKSYTERRAGRSKDASKGSDKQDVKDIDAKIQKNAKSINNAKTVDERLAIMEKHDDLEYQLALALNEKTISGNLTPDEEAQLAVLGNIRDDRDILGLINRVDGLFDDVVTRANLLTGLVNDLAKVKDEVTAGKFIESFVTYVSSESKTLPKLVIDPTKNNDKLMTDDSTGVKLLSTAYRIGRVVEIVSDMSASTPIGVSYPAIVPTKRESFTLSLISYPTKKTLVKRAGETFPAARSDLDKAYQTLEKATETIRRLTRDELVERNELIRDVLLSSDVKYGLSSAFPSKIPVLVMRELAFVTSAREWCLNAQAAIVMYPWEV